MTVRAAAVVLLAPAAAAAAPYGVRLSYTGDPSDSIAVTWNTDAPTATSVVRYGTAPGALSELAEGVRFQAPAPLGWVHEVEIEGLRPDTLYYYQAGDAAGGWSELLSLRTGPAPHQRCGAFRFAMLADERPEPDLPVAENWPRIAAEVASESPPPAFLLHAGDIVDDGSDPRQWRDWLEASGVVLSRFAHMPSIGNHDDGPGEGNGAIYNQVFQLPIARAADGGSDSEDYYFFTYGNAIFASISTQTHMGGPTGPFSEQAAWLDRVLSANPRLWKFVFLHHPVYTGEIEVPVVGTRLNHPPNEQGQNAALVPVLDRHHVDVVLQSHNHWYERFAPSACGDGRDRPCPTGDAATGTVYLTSGGAGALTFDLDLGVEVPFCRWSETGGRDLCDGRHHYVVADLDGGRLSVSVWATSAQNFGDDPANHVLIDSFAITKPGPSPDECATLGREGESEAEAEGNPIEGEGEDRPGGPGPVTAGEGEGEPEPAASPPAAPSDGCGCRLGARR